MNKYKILAIKVLRKLFHKRRWFDKNLVKQEGKQDKSMCQFIGQVGNNEILRLLENSGGKGFMLSKWGTIELAAAVGYYFSTNRPKLRNYMDCIWENYYSLWISNDKGLFSNAGVFPPTMEMKKRFGALALEDCRAIDVLGSYAPAEHAISDLMKDAVKVNLDAFYAPFLWKNPWTKWLRGKRVLVVHPFVESIKRQYEQNRDRLFDDSDVLPKFGELILVKAVQSMGGSNDQFKDWFEALEYMKREIDSKEYDVAIIGCGAYGMSLAAHVKRQGKVALHLAGWTQMLFGVYGKRWKEQQTRYSRFINEYWVRPSAEETPMVAKKVEEGCYW